MPAMACFVTAALCALGGRLAAQEEARPPVSVSLSDASGRPLEGGQAAAKVAVSGRVLDAETGQPLPVFTLTEGRQDRQNVGVDWQEKGRRTFANGVFDVSVAKERLAPAVLIEAQGYLPQSSGLIYGLGTNLTFLLKKGTGPAGVLLTPDGRPAAGRTVYLSRRRDLISIQGPQLEARANDASGARSARTDAAGRFSFAPDIDAYAVLAVDAAGFALARVEDLKAAPEVRLQPCARLEGTLRIGARAGSNETVRLTPAFSPYQYYPRPLPPYSFSLEATTDDAGHFVFPLAPPVDLKIFHSPRIGGGGEGLIAVTQITNLTLQPGETRQVTLGGQGRPVVGRVVLKGYDKALDWRDQLCSMELLESEPPGQPSFDPCLRGYEQAMRAAKSAGERIAAQARLDREREQIGRQFQAFYASGAGRHYWFSKRSYALQFAQDGSFRIEDVPGGKYQLTIEAREPGGGHGQHRPPPITLHSQEVQVPDPPGGRSDVPFDLGAIETVPRLYPGTMAPEFAVRTLDDKTIRLSDFRGKFVLLDFWAAGSAPCLEQTPYLMETYAAFKDDPRFALIGLSLDTNAAAPRDYARTNHLGWTQGFLGNGPQSEVPNRYGVERLPSILLVGPEGRVLVAGLRGGTIKSTVDVALNSHR
jgi:thiol-disulfide isomerase/thioredoxin